jgi:hypothetical protein
MATEIKNDGFWPDIDIDDFLQTEEVPKEQYNSEAIKLYLKSAIRHTNEDLTQLKSALKAIGVAVFADYAEDNSDDSIDEQPALSFYYQHAVYCYAKFNLAQVAANLGRSVTFEDASEKDNGMSEHLMREYSWAIGLLFSKCAIISSLTFDETIPSNITSTVI